MQSRGAHRKKTVDNPLLLIVIFDTRTDRGGIQY